MLNRWQRTIVDLRGNVVPYAQLQILREQTQSAPTIYRDKSGTEVIPNAIVTANQNGYAYFYAPADLYRIRSTEPVIDWRDVDLGSAAAQQLAQQALDNAVPTYETLVDMQADTGQPVPTLGRVVNDSTLEDNGYYVWTGSAWERAAYQPLSDMDVSIEPAPSKIPRATGDGVIREAWVEDLPFNYDQIYAQLWSARYPGIPAPSFYQEFGGGASLLDPRITFSRPSKAWGWRNGVLVEYDVDEPVFENGGLRLEPQATNYTINSEGEFYNQLYNVDANYLEDGLAEVYSYTAEEQASTGRRAIIAPLDLRYFVVDGGVATFALDMKPVDAESATIATHINGSRAVSFLFEDPSQHLYGRNEGHPPLFNFNYTYLPDGFIRVSVSGQYIAEDEFTYYFNAPSRGVPGYNHYGSTILVRRPQLVAGGLATSYIPTNGQPATRPADNFSIDGAAFSSIFDPNEGALVLPHSSFGEGNIITLGGLQVARTEDGLELNNTAIPDTEGAKQNLKLRWGSNGLDVFVGNTKALHDIPIPANWGDADSLVLADNDSAGKYIDRLAMLTEAPTDSNMEGM